MNTHDKGWNGAVAAVLRGERAAQAMTIEELADRASIPAVSVQRFLAARRAMSIEVMASLAGALRMDMAEVITLAQQRMDKAHPELVAHMRAGLQQARPDVEVDDGVSLTQSIEGR